MCGGEHVVDGGWRWRERWGGGGGWVGAMEEGTRGDKATLLLLLVFLPCNFVRSRAQEVLTSGWH